MKFSPSAAERWFVCPASTVYVDIAPPRPQSPEAKRGSNAHCYGELVLKDKIDYSFLESILSEEDSIAIQYYVDYIKELETKINLKNQGKIEQFFSIAIENQKVRGKIDYVLLDQETKTAYVIDYKHGVGVIVDVEFNKQLILYAMGTLAIANHYNIEINNFELSIIQPRSYSGSGLKTWKVSLRDLKPYFKEVKDRISYIINNPDEEIPSSECKWCPGLFLCKKVKHYIEFFENEIPETTLEISEIKKLLALKETVVGYFNELEKYAKELTNKNKLNPKDIGYKWVQKRSSRHWIDETRLIKKLEWLEDSLIKKSLAPMSIIQKKKGKQFVEDNTYRQEGALALVPESDKRTEIVPINQAKRLMGVKEQ